MLMYLLFNIFIFLEIIIYMIIKASFYVPFLENRLPFDNTLFLH